MESHHLLHSTKDQPWAPSSPPTRARPSAVLGSSSNCTYTKHHGLQTKCSDNNALGQASWRWRLCKGPRRYHCCRKIGWQISRGRCNLSTGWARRWPRATILCLNSSPACFSPTARLFLYCWKSKSPASSASAWSYWQMHRSGATGRDGTFSSSEPPPRFTDFFKIEKLSLPNSSILRVGPSVGHWLMSWILWSKMDCACCASSPPFNGWSRFLLGSLESPCLSRPFRTESPTTGTLIGHQLLRPAVVYPDWVWKHCCRPLSLLRSVSARKKSHGSASSSSHRRWSLEADSWTRSYSNSWRSLHPSAQCFFTSLLTAPSLKISLRQIRIENLHLSTFHYWTVTISPR